MDDLDKEFDKKFVSSYGEKFGFKSLTTPKEIKLFIRSREKELLNKWEAAIRYSDHEDGTLESGIMENHFNLTKKELSNE